jgi:ankyrin repeat protein
MKILIIYLEEEKGKSDKLIAFLEKLNISIELLPVKPQEEGRRSMELRFSAFFGMHDETPTHVVVLSALSPGWIDFIAGFSCGSHVPILVCGKEEIACVPEVFAFCFKEFQNERELQNYIKDATEAFKKAEAEKETNDARQTLLNKGIPFTNDSLAQCVADDLVMEVSLFLAGGFSPNTKSKTGVPLLNISARSGSLKMFKLLLKAGADVNLLADDRSSSALIDSTITRHCSMVKDLIAAGAELDVKSKDGQTALVLAVGSGDEEIAASLLKAGADPDLQDSMGVSARKYAALFNKKGIVSLFDTYAPKKA